MPTVIGYHEVKDSKHWLASPKREEVFRPLGVTNIRTFVDPENPTRVMKHLVVCLPLDLVQRFASAVGVLRRFARRGRARRGSPRRTR
jgi:hypothetical protein